MAPTATKMGLGNLWAKDFKAALDAETWGDQEEAKSAYLRLSQRMADEYASGTCASITQREMETVEKLAICFRLRANELKKRESSGISMDNVKALKPVMDTLFKQGKKFPLDLSSVDDDDLRKAKGDLGLEHGSETVIKLLGRGVKAKAQQPAATRSRSSDGEVEALETGTVSSAVSDDASEASLATTVAVSHSIGTGAEEKPAKTGRLVKIKLDTIGFKDEKLNLVDPIISAYWVCTNRMSGVQIDSKVSTGKDGKYFLFAGDTLTMQSTLESIIPGSALILEFKHFKKDKNKMSTKCWAFLDRSEVTEGEHVLELYKKPVDMRRKKLSLFTIKPLYLHLDVELQGQRGHSDKPTKKKTAFGGSLESSADPK